MFQAIADLISMFWNGLKQLPFFDTGFDFSQVFLFLIGFSLVVPILGILLGGSGDN